MSTYTPIASQTLGSAAASVTFSSIPQGYTDLVVVINGATTADTSAFIRFNSDSSSLYSYTEINGNGSSATSSRATSSTSSFFGNPRTSYQFQANLSINNYSNSTTFKNYLSRSGNASNWAFAVTGLYRSTSAITSVSFIADGTTWTSGSTFSLYGIQVGDKAQKAQGGNRVIESSGYIYHVFTSSGSFIPNEAISADMLIIAGGGGGGAGHAGGGGAGGYRSITSQSLTAKSYPVIVGAGGRGAFQGGDAKGISGSNSSFGTNSSTGGGGGGSRWDANGASGGSGGGAAYYGSAGSGNAGGYTPVEGYAGGGGGGANSSGSGGGGAGGAGTTDTNGENGENGGAGSNAHSSWASATGTGVSGYYAGGGGGGAYTPAGDYYNGSGGSGGGGGGGQATEGNPGTTNTGSGGGGGAVVSVQKAGGNGGSGIVIIRYAV